MAWVGKIKFIILAAPRTGSTLLGLSLNQHPHLTCIHEPMHTRKDIREQAVKNLIKSCENPQDWMNEFYQLEGNVGFKQIYFNDKSQIDSQIVFDYLKQHQIKIIHLIRENILDSYVSLRMAIKTGVWRMDQDEWNDIPRQVYIQPQECKKYFQEVEEMQEKIRSLPNEKMEITYHELTTEYEKTLNQCFDFLEVEQMKINQPLNKLKKSINPLKNGTELKKYFQNTKYEKFFRLIQKPL